jgi:hypothetical protein
MGEIWFEYHHVTSPNGESNTLRCPHCKKEILIEAKALEGDPDRILIKYSKGGK